jgi:hypothetical protein
MPRPRGAVLSGAGADRLDGRVYPWTRSDGSEPAAISRVGEAEIPEDLRNQLQALLQMCFAGYSSRSYFKLPPHFRYLAVAGGELAGQAGVELRVIKAGGNVLRTFGVVDLCVRDSERSRSCWQAAGGSNPACLFLRDGFCHPHHRPLRLPGPRHIGSHQLAPPTAGRAQERPQPVPAGDANPCRHARLPEVAVIP